MIEQNFEPKKSIREYVNEFELKFELMAMKYSMQLQKKHNLERDTITVDFNKEKQKRTEKIEKTIIKEGEDIGDIGVAALRKNIQYINDLIIPLDEAIIREDFRLSKEMYRASILERLADVEIIGSKRKGVEEELAYVDDLILTPKHSKERFGKMLMLIIRNLAVKPSFAGYTDNWKDEFFSNAIEKTLLYSHNFDENLLSKRTGKKSKAFAYITQICFNAFIAILNDRKKELKIIKDVISYEQKSVEGYVPYKNENLLEGTEMPEILKEYEVEFIPGSSEIGGDMDNIVDFVEWQINYALKQNEKRDKNKLNQTEINILEKTTPQEKKGPDYIAYIRDLEQHIEPLDYPYNIDILKIITPKDFFIATTDRVKIYNDKPSLLELIIEEKGTIHNRKVLIIDDEEMPLILEDISEEW